MPLLVRLLLCVGLTLPALVPTAALADSELVRDERREVVRLTFTHACRTTAVCHKRRSVDPDNRVGDIVYSRSTYAQRALYLKVKVRRMTTRRSIAAYIGWDLQLADGEGISAQLLYSAGHKSFDLIATWGDFHCRSARSRIDRERRIYIARVPVTCLRKAEWLRVSASTYISGDKENSAWYDVAGLGSDLKLTYEVAEKNYGREIYRGPAQDPARS